MIIVDHTNEMEQLFASLWDCEGFNGLDFFFWYGHNTVTSDVITQVLKFVGSKAWLAGVDLDPILLEAGKYLFKDSNMFYPRAFCDMQKVIDVNMYGV